MKKLLFLFVFVSALIVVAGSCSQSPSNPDEPTPTPVPTPQPGTISGTLSGLPATPGVYHVYVDTDFNKANGFITETNGAYASGSGSQAYSVTVTGGTYYVYSFLDLNSNSIPEAGEYLGIYDTVYPAYPASANAAVNGGITNTDITLSAASNNLSGTITLGADGGGNNYTIVVDLDGSGGTSDDFVTVAMGTVSGTTLDYDLLIPHPCSAYVYCIVDMNGSGGAPDTGDQVGMYPSLASPSPINITDLSAGATDNIDFGMSIM